jgi:hypothetical protein
VLNYNHLERKPYYIQYDTGNETEFVVKNRIKGLEGSVKPTVKTPPKKVEGEGASRNKATTDASPLKTSKHFTRAKGQVPEIKEEEEGKEEEMEEKEEEGGGAPSHNLFNILQGGQ